LRKGNVKKRKETATEKLSGPAGVGTAGPGQHIRISLRKSLRSAQEHLTSAEEETEKKLAGTAIKKLSRRGFQDFLGNGYEKPRRRVWAGSQFLGFLTVQEGVRAHGSGKGPRRNGPATAMKRGWF